MAILPDGLAYWDEIEPILKNEPGALESYLEYLAEIVAWLEADRSRLYERVTAYELALRTVKQEATDALG